MEARNLVTIDFIAPKGGGGDLGVRMVLQASKPVWHTLDHEYHERLNTHGMVLESRDNIELGDTMIYTIEKW